MPLGSKHEETGLLRREGTWLILERTDGGRWRLEAEGADGYVGRRVRIEGVRSGFDLLEVTSISDAG